MTVKFVKNTYYIDRLSDKTLKRKMKKRWSCVIKTKVLNECLRHGQKKPTSLRNYDVPSSGLILMSVCGTVFLWKLIWTGKYALLWSSVFCRSGWDDNEKLQGSLLVLNMKSAQPFANIFFCTGCLLTSLLKWKFLSSFLPRKFFERLGRVVVSLSEE